MLTTVALIPQTACFKQRRGQREEAEAAPTVTVSPRMGLGKLVVGAGALWAC